MTTNTRSFFIAVICSITLLLLGCGNSGDNFVFTNTNNNTQTGFQLDVAADPGALARGEVLAQFAPEVVNLRVNLFDAALQPQGTQTVARNATASFFFLAAGDYLVRMEGLNAAGDVVGYFDKVVTVGSPITTVTFPTLIADTTPPAPVFPAAGGAPSFLVFISTPSTIAASTRFSVTVQAFDAQGNPVTSAVSGVSLVSNDIAFEVDPADQDTSAAGLVTFSDLTFGQSATGTTTFSARATGLTSVTSFATTVTAPPNFFASMELISAAIGGGEPDGASQEVSVSRDGRFIAFESDSTDLVAGDSEGFDDVFVRDRQTGTTERVSVDSAGNAGDADSSFAAISDDGRYVCFQSDATNLVASDTNNRRDVFIHDRQTGTTELVSVDSLGVQGAFNSGAPSVSADGNLVAFVSRSAFSDAGVSGDEQVYLRNRSAGTTILVTRDSSAQGPASLGNNRTDIPRITGNGLFIIMQSACTNLGVMDDNNGRDDAYVYDVANGTFSIANRDVNGVLSDFGATQPAISENGQFASFTSSATNLVPGGVNQGNIYHKNLSTGAIVWITQAVGGGASGSSNFDSRISGDGRFVVFYSGEDDLVSNDGNGTDEDIFVFDSLVDELTIATLADDGSSADSDSGIPAISRDGSVISFESDATNFVSASPVSGNELNIYSVSNPFRR